jgi:hypothetical protein
VGQWAVELSAEPRTGSIVTCGAQFHVRLKLKADPDCAG